MSSALRRRVLPVVLAVGCLPASASLVVVPAHAQTPPAPSAPSPGASAPVVVARAAAEAQAREAFLTGVALVREERWSDALVAFDRSVADRPHPVTYYNMALCHRALGRPVRAVFALERALSDEGEERLAEDKAAEARKLLAELRAKRAFAVIEVKTTETGITVDGQPLERVGEASVKSLLPGAPSAVVSEKVRLVLDPGRHTLRIVREGHEAWVHEASFEPNETKDFAVSLHLLPSVLAVRANIEGARLVLDEKPIGLLPQLVERPFGPHRVEVARTGYTPFVTEVVLRPGARTDVLATLRPEKVPLTKKWWFYAGIGAVVTAVGVTTYALTRPTEKADGGSLGWVVRP